MQPDRDKTDWQQPTSQPSQAPYAAVPQESPVRTPVVTLVPDAFQSTTQERPIVADDGENPMVMSNDAQADNHAVVPLPESKEEPVHWQATEYIHREKDAMWFTLFAIVVVVLMAVSVLFIQSITFTILIPVMAAALLVYTHRPPRMLDYTLSHQGLHINDTLYPFIDFKGFGVVHDGQEYSVILIPTRRFKLGVSVYFPEEAGEAIVDILGTRLPMQELHLDMFDKIIHKLRI